MKINPTKTIYELVKVLAYITDVEEKKKLYHAWRVAILAVSFAENKVSQKRLKEVFYASLLHDVGGVGFPFHIIHYLQKKDKASQNILLSHPIIGAELVSNIPEMTQSAKFILDHHEWINGQGYPRSKTKKNIPFESQIIRIADAIDIYLQTERFRSLKKLEETMSSNINKEYSENTFDIAFKVLSKGDFFNKIYKRSNVPGLLNETQDKVGFIHIPIKIDAIGVTLQSFAQIIDMKHPYTSGHSQRVSRYAMAIALSMNLAHDEITRIKWSGLIHDIGKLSVSRRILDKTSNLTATEYRKIQTHAHLTENMINMIASLREIALIAASHHERFDGSGYPRGLKEREIPLGARILAICDAFDAMTSNRPYRNPLSPQKACREIEKRSGTQFDPALVKISVPLLRNLWL